MLSILTVFANLVYPFPSGRDQIRSVPVLALPVLASSIPSGANPNMPFPRNDCISNMLSLPLRSNTRLLPAPISDDSKPFPLVLSLSPRHLAHCAPGVEPVLACLSRQCICPVPLPRDPISLLRLPHSHHVPSLPAHTRSHSCTHASLKRSSLQRWLKAATFHCIAYPCWGCVSQSAGKKDE